MDLLLDSHTILWTLFDPSELPTSLHERIMDERTTLYVSLAMFWEIGLKASLGRLPMTGNSPEALFAEIHRLGITVLPITEADIRAAVLLPHHHGDPFDRMLIAQSLRLNVPIASKDQKFPAYGVELVWS